MIDKYLIEVENGEWVPMTLTKMLELSQLGADFRHKRKRRSTGMKDENGEEIWENDIVEEISKKETFIIKRPILGWEIGEQLVYDPTWCEWRRRKTGETFNTRQSIGDGEVTRLLNYARLNKLTSILELKS